MIPHNSAERNQIGSPFLRLPAEIRNMIYRFALDKANVSIVGDMPLEKLHCELSDTSLLQTCRQIRNESQSFVNTFTTLLLAGQDHWHPTEMLNTLAHQRQPFSTVEKLYPDQGKIDRILADYGCCLRINRLDTFHVVYGIYP